MKSDLLKTMYAADNRMQYDAACKRAFSEKIILAWIMKHCVSEYKDCDVKEIAEKYIEGEPQVSEIPVMPDETNRISGLNTEDVTITEGTVYYDIRFFALAPVSNQLIRLIINIEPQNDFYPGYHLLRRGVYYCARMLSSQYGTEFTEANYDDMKKVYSIWICSHPPKSRMNTITQYSMTEKNIIGSVKEQMRNYDLLSVIMVCLGNPDDENDSDLLRLLDVLLSRELSLEQKRQVLNTEFDIQMSSKLEGEVSVMCNLSQGIFNEGLTKGLNEGMAKGFKEKQLNDLRSLIKNTGWEIEKAMAVLDVPETERSEYAKLLRQ